MDEALAIFNYLPVSFKSEEEQAYIAFLWDAFQSNYENENYQFAFLAFHMLTMCYIYCNLWQIRSIAPDDYHKAMVGFTKDEEKKLLSRNSLFNFGGISESKALRILRLLGCDSAQIGNYAKLVDDRNDVAHPNGNIFYSTQQALDTKLAAALRLIDEIERHSSPLILCCYENFLKNSADAEAREHIDEGDQVREVLIHENYFSRRDIEFCLKYDIQTLTADPQFDGIVALHNALLERYGEEEY